MIVTTRPDVTSSVCLRGAALDGRERDHATFSFGLIPRSCRARQPPIVMNGALPVMKRFAAVGKSSDSEPAVNSFFGSVRRRAAALTSCGSVHLSSEVMLGSTVRAAMSTYWSVVSEPAGQMVEDVVARPAPRIAEGDRIDAVLLERLGGLDEAVPAC